MFMLRPYVETIERLIAEGSAASLVYAALECRLAIELVCYERLRVAHDYISHEDLRRWRPGDVVSQLIAEVDEGTAETRKIDVSPDAPATNDAEGYSKVEWTLLGTQVGFDPKKLGGLWHALSNVALHMKLPEAKEEVPRRYGDSEEVKRKVTEALSEIRRISEGTLIWSMGGDTVSFTCGCGAINKRRAKLLTTGQIINCMNPTCDESYECVTGGQEIVFERRVLTVACQCEGGTFIPMRSAEKLKPTEWARAMCKVCGDEVLLRWQLMQSRRASDASGS